MYVQIQPQLDACIAILQASNSFAFDLEFDRDRYTYGFDLCLMQIATPENCFIIDPHATIELQPIYRLFEKPGIRKLVHCPGEDLRLLNSLNCRPANLVDTEIYARLLNYEQTSLGNMLRLTCDLELDKKLQTSNWCKRPLTEAQLAYAAADVVYLHQMESILQQQAQQKGLMPYVQQEQDLLNETDFTIGPKESFLRAGDLRHLSPYHQFVLNGLFVLRDKLARQYNKPAHQIMPEELVRNLADGQLSLKDWQLQQGIYPKLRSGAFVGSLATEIANLKAEANARGLLKNRQPKTAEPEGEQQRLSRREQDAIKAEVFAPVQAHIASQLGEYAARFVLSTRVVNEILSGERKLTKLKPAYRLNLIYEAAAALRIKLPGITSEN
jgi:ribonuclease D